MPGRLPAQAGLMVGQQEKYMSWHVYILRSLRNRWYYVGSTNRIEERLKEHNAKKVLSTKYYAPLKLVFLKKFNLEKDARVYEKKIKGRRIEKEKIIRKIENKK